MSSIEDKKDNSPPTAGDFYAQETNWLNKNLAQILINKNIPFDNNSNTQISDNLSYILSTPFYYNNITYDQSTKKFTLKYIGSGLSEINSYTDGMLIYTEYDLNYYDQAAGKEIVIDTAPTLSLKNNSIPEDYLWSSIDINTAYYRPSISGSTPYFGRMPLPQGDYNTCANLYKYSAPDLITQGLDGIGESLFLGYAWYFDCDKNNKRPGDQGFSDAYDYYTISLPYAINWVGGRAKLGTVGLITLGVLNRYGDYGTALVFTNLQNNYQDAKLKIYLRGSLLSNSGVRLANISGYVVCTVIGSDYTEYDFYPLENRKN